MFNNNMNYFNNNLEKINTEKMNNDFEKKRII